ncbi:PREDICTED: flavin-containing monooxygenase FMO GS-OX-like 4 [Dinoponera quadriceps]|uniref:Flavin-containing monooxygenase n=1 Tax=Dinoponera quadriceps TaxID=609295 RepID=A0A6P3WN60_DINQU|nr:PREDICTED: flavin-containing monooxygenase FMO GS-OX-like 4 [Dinoponera quadriceps]XP_014467560.1 PREDICTED: flavin-containing monooxygenase FMO GS-OX-like 4 [Dinoponera quadriceps]XP_014467564.1 PREDICTED: flavin-containing monooxygenase FMO GS-OX-like 4 [Dinoponera quadriceps]XP_014467571.1 PREDICTED: flavin-containing monooxygenase FMO GS-OX-like 4 [Dinoponera quadriceps]XP_014467580.1 PREDICTED: flavin-containing monooxygenase FMO GS-OX-like 4 [Dinoponera quadriceps]
MAEQTGKIKVCVIGGGAAGLCAIRHLVGNSKFETTAYEQMSKIGGTWVYTEQVGLDENGLPIHSSMYQNLRTNLPAKIMNFPDYMTMDAQEPSCVSHQEVLNYLKNYTQQFDIRRHIHFNTRVEHVRFEPSENSRNRDRWLVQVKNVKTNETENRYFDAIMVCNGHYFDPYIPNIPGIESFPGLILHSHAYRKPEEFSGKTVLVLGAASSGIDIGIDLSNYTTRVYLSHNHDRLTSPLPSNMTQVAGVESIYENTFHLKDKSTVDADVFIFCTGYKYSFPFLDENCGIRVDDNYVIPLYKHLVNIEHPTMCIVGIPTLVVPFPMFHMQVQYFLALLDGQITLPAENVMLEDSALKTLKKRHAHKLMDQQWDYNDSLAITGGFERLPLFYKLGYTALSVQRRTNLLRYKDSKFIVSKDGKSVELTIQD